jgi:hypothetical protein
MTEQTRWVDTGTDAEARHHRDAFWARLRADVQQGAFWADEIKQLHGDPPARLEKAIANLPLPAAFREAAIATRAIIRTKRKRGENWDAELGLLYWLAAIDSFRLDYSQRLQQPGFNVLEAIPAKTLFDLPFDYDTLGYKHLTLLNKTDVKWLTERWGEPSGHTTLNALHADTWRAYEDKAAERRNREDAAFMRSIGLEQPEAPSRPTETRRARPPASNRPARLILAAVAVLVLIALLAD